MKRPLQNSILGPVLILAIAALVIAWSWHKNSIPATPAAIKTTDAPLPRSVLHYPACDPAKDGKDCDQPLTTPCYAGAQYQKLLSTLKQDGLNGIAHGNLSDGRQLIVYQSATAGAFILLAIGEDGQHQTEACQLGVGQNWRGGAIP